MRVIGLPVSLKELLDSEMNVWIQLVRIGHSPSIADLKEVA